MIKVQVVSVIEMEAPKKRARKTVEPLELKRPKPLVLEKQPEPVVVQPREPVVVKQPEPVVVKQEPVAVKPEPVVPVSSKPAMKIPIPSTVGFAEDEKFRGITAAMDRVLDAVHRDGWSLQKVYESPLAILPLPVGKFPPGRAYLFSDSVAVVVNSHTGSIVTSLPATAALKTLNQYTPDVIENDEWASARWAEFLGDALPEDIDTSPRWYKQTHFDRAGSIWVVKRVHDGAKIFCDGQLLHLVKDDVAAEDLGLSPVLVELVAFVLEIE